MTSLTAETVIRAHGMALLFRLIGERGGNATIGELRQALNDVVSKEPAAAMGAMLFLVDNGGGDRYRNCQDDIRSWPYHAVTQPNRASIERN